MINQTNAIIAASCTAAALVGSCGFVTYVKVAHMICGKRQQREMKDDLISQIDTTMNMLDMHKPEQASLTLALRTLADRLRRMKTRAIDSQYMWIDQMLTSTRMRIANGGPLDANIESCEAVADYLCEKFHLKIA